MKAHEDPFAKLYKEAWDFAKNGQEEEAQKVMSKLEEEYSKILENLGKAQEEGNKDMEKDLLTDAWQKASDVEEFSVYRDIGPYEFSKTNPFMGEGSPLEKALFFISAGK